MRVGRTGRACTSRVAARLAGFLLLPVCLLLPRAAAADGEVVVSGNAALSDARIEEVLGQAADDRALLEAGVDSLLRLYAAAGRPFARVEARTEGHDGRLLVSVHEGPVATIGALRLEGVRALDRAELRILSGLSEGDALTPSALAGAASALVDAYAEAGRPLAAVRPVVSAVDGGRFDVTLEVDEGPEVVFARPVAVGNEVTREDVIVRESGIVAGRPFSRLALERSRRRLERTGLFSDVSGPSLAFARGRSEAVPVFEVEEASVNRVLGALGYAPGDERLSGSVEVALGNIAGTGRRAEVHWKRLPGDERRAAFAYLEPWLLGAPVDVGVSGSQTVRDTISTVTEGDLTVTARMGDRSRIAWSVGAERYVPGAGPESATQSARTALAAAFDATEPPGNPRRGLSLEASVEYAAKEIDDTGERERSGTARVGVIAYVPLSLRQTIALGGTGAGIWSSEADVPFHEEIPLGGATGPRGYREDQFRGVRVATGSVEYRYLIGRSSRLLAFVDGAWYRRDGSNPATDTKLGYGIGLRGATALGIIAVDYGLGEGDSLLDGKLHVGFTRAF